MSNQELQFLKEEKIRLLEQINYYGQKIEEAKVEEQMLKERLEQMKIDSKNAKELKQELDDITSTLLIKVAEVEKQEKLAKRFESEIKQLRLQKEQAYKDLKSSLESVENDYNALVVKQETSKIDIDKLQDEIEDLQEQQKELQKGNRESVIIHNVLQKEVADLVQTRKDYLGGMIGVNSEMEAKSAELAKLNDLIAVKYTQIKNLEEQIHSLMEDSVDEKRKISLAYEDFQKRMAEKEKELKDRESEISIRESWVKDKEALLKHAKMEIEKFYGKRITTVNI